MIIGVLINGLCMVLLGKWAIRAFKARLALFGWLMLFASSWNLALVMKYVTD